MGLPRDVSHTTSWKYVHLFLHSGLTSNPPRLDLDPKLCQFSRGQSPTTSSQTDIWTETPAEPLQRFADEVSRGKRRVADAPVKDEGGKTKKRRRKQQDEFIKHGVDDYTRTKRGAALVDQHASTVGTKSADKEPPGIWDHSRDMWLGGRLMDDEKRGKMLKEAKGLGGSFWQWQK